MVSGKLWKTIWLVATFPTPPREFSHTSWTSPPSPLWCFNCSLNRHYCVVNQSQSSCLRCCSLNIDCTFHPPLPVHSIPPGLLCHNCYEYTKSHRKCSVSNISSECCVWCQKIHLSCYFKVSGKLTSVIVCINYDMHSILYHVSNLIIIFSARWP